MTNDDAWAIEARTRAAVAERVRAVLRLISPEHITPDGVRQIDRVLEEVSPAEAVLDEDVVRGGGRSSVPPLDWDF